MKLTYEDSRRALVAVLRQHGDEATEHGFDELSLSDQQFLIVTAAANVMLHQICYTAGYNEASALEGVTALELAKHVKDICDTYKKDFVQ